MDRPRRTKLATFENLEYLRLQAIIRKVRWRWRLKMLLRGLGFATLAGLLTLLASRGDSTRSATAPSRR